MPGRRVRRNALRGSRNTGRSRYRRRSAVSKVYRQRPTAHNQKRQIARVTRLALANRARFNSVYTDYQISPTSDPSDLGYTWPLVNGAWQIIRLTNFDQWQAVLRSDNNVLDSNHTFVKRISVNMRAQVSSGYATCNFFIFRTRFPEGPRDVFSDPPSTPNQDFAENTSIPGSNIRLNSAKFKVLASQYCTLRTAPRGSVSLPDPNATFIPGDPLPAEKRWQWTLNPRIKVHQTASTGAIPGRWIGKPFESLPYYDRLYLAAFITFDAATTRGAWYADPLFTCVNNL